MSNDIQVSGLSCYPEERWREAILHFLFGVWGNKDQVMYRPKISFGGIVLRLNTSNCEYYAYKQASVSQEEPPPCSSCDLVEHSGRQADIEVALIRFVKDNRIKQLRLWLRSGQEIIFWKKDKRGEYGCCTSLPLPSQEDVFAL